MTALPPFLAKTVRSSARAPRVTVLLATWNGAANLRAQLDSYCAQTLPPARLIVSDDGSTDGTVAILRDFAASAPGFAVDLLEGPRRGGAQNFLHLLQAVPEGTDWVALSDQDDVWLPEKIASGVQMLAQVPEGQPALLGGRSFVCDADLGQRRLSPLPRRSPAFRHALVQNFAGGNTMMLNRAGVDLVRAAAAEAGRVVVHDWWLYQIVSGTGGTVIFDPAPLLLYRQHAGNQIGANSGVEAKVKRLRWMLRGRFRRWNAINLAALRASAHRFPPENRLLLEDFAKLQRADLIGRLTILRRLGLYRHGLQGTLSLWLAAALGRI
ncbi:MAG: glycosyltransferase family 2 protein [Rhodobacteraceae bacterium]|nr:glycosyltransferase family 2 protein [Paracoccaceae bacterium]